ncbi:unnamed protein product [Symbiodinium microadriaticum]|nr:unnamed protein product [Symbiodinium microadriaticum]
MQTWVSGRPEAALSHGLHAGSSEEDVGSVPLDCAGRPEMWDSQKRSWCCGIPGIHCGSTVAVVIHHHVIVPYHCDAGYSHWSNAWSSAKQDFCCQHSGRGCQAYHCREGFETSYNTWSSSKRAYCCAHFQMGCKVMNYDCSADLSHWQHKWTEHKKSWCCKTVGKGCPKTYSCTTSAVNKPSTWAQERQDWCCLQYGVGCPHYSAPYECKGGTADILGWSKGRRDWCCKHYHRGCAKDVVTKPFDCSAGLHDSKTLWPKSKKEWCCHHEKRGCDSVLGGSFDCDEGFENWQRGWSPSKQEWCCAQESKGCAEHFTCERSKEDEWSEAEQDYCCDKFHYCRTEPAEVFDCKAGYEDWEHLWSPAKQEWCCNGYGRGCPVSEPFDCQAGLSNWHAGWSDKKKDYCCHKHELGCDSDEGESIGSMQIDCASDYINWQKWSSGKKLYCCDKYNLACEGSDHHVHHVTGMVDHIHAEPYDCAAGFDNWHRGWSRHKKGYCCDKYQLGCSHGYMGGLGWHDLHATPGRVSVTTVHHHHIHVHG